MTLFSYQTLMKVFLSDLMTYQYWVKKRILLPQLCFQQSWMELLDESYKWPLQMSSLLDTFGPPVRRIPGLFGVVQQRGSEKERAKVGMCKGKNDAIVCCWWKGAESRSSLKSGILSAWQEHKCWHLP